MVLDLVGIAFQLKNDDVRSDVDTTGQRKTFVDVELFLMLLGFSYYFVDSNGYALLLPIEKRLFT